MKILYLLDTNICIYITKQNSQLLMDRFEQLKVGDAAMSIISYGELVYGIQKSKYYKQNHYALMELISFIEPVALPSHAAVHYGEIRGNLEKEGKPIGNNDLWIAAHALSIDTTLVTNNMKEFNRIPNLKLENWVE